MSSGWGWWVSAQLALVRGRGRGGAGAPQILITCPGLQGTLCPCSLFMIRVGRPWNLLLLLMGPRSSSLMTSWVPGSLASCYLFLVVVLGRCNRPGPIKKSPSEGETSRQCDFFCLIGLIQIYTCIHTCQCHMRICQFKK